MIILWKKKVQKRLKEKNGIIANIQFCNKIVLKSLQEQQQKLSLVSLHSQYRLIPSVIPFFGLLISEIVHELPVAVCVNFSSTSYRPIIHWNWVDHWLFLLRILKL